MKKKYNFNFMSDMCNNNKDLNVVLEERIRKVDRLCEK